jgi:DNA-binding response OmpR family regulator
VDFPLIAEPTHPKLQFIRVRPDETTHIHEDVFDRSINVQIILRLLRKLETDPRVPRIIQTERGVGYAFAMPVERLA